MGVGADEAGDDRLAGAVDDLRAFGRLGEGGADVLDEAFVDPDVDVLASGCAGAVHERGVVEDEWFLLGAGGEGSEADKAQDADGGAHRTSEFIRMRLCGFLLRHAV
jgi:hypothetical protein